MLPAGATVPIGWIAVGDPAEILPPDQHERVWAIQKPLDFPRQDGSVSSLLFRGVDNTRDYPMNPTTGHYNTASIEVGYAQLTEQATDSFGNSLYPKFLVDLRRYMPLKKITQTKEPERERHAERAD